MSLRNLTAIGLGVVGCCATVFALLVFTQKIQTQTRTGKDWQDAIARKGAEQKQLFWKESSTDDPADPGNKIVAVRRVKLHVEGVDAKGFSINRSKDLVEIEIHTSVEIPATDAMQYVLVGDRIFLEPRRSGDGRTVFIQMSPEEFAQIKDDSIVSYAISSRPPEAAQLKESYRNGEPNKVSGAKFGRIKKSMLARTPLLEEDTKAQNMRIQKARTRSRGAHYDPDLLQRRNMNVLHNIVGKCNFSLWSAANVRNRQ